MAAARALFQNKSTRGQDFKAESDTLWTTHENAITCLQSVEADRDGRISRFPSSALDGNIVIWELNKLDIDFTSLKI